MTAFFARYGESADTNRRLVSNLTRFGFRDTIQLSVLVSSPTSVAVKSAEAVAQAFAVPKVYTDGRLAYGGNAIYKLEDGQATTGASTDRGIMYATRQLFRVLRHEESMKRHVLFLSDEGSSRLVHLLEGIGERDFGTAPIALEQGEVIQINPTMMIDNFDRMLRLGFHELP